MIFVRAGGPPTLSLIRYLTIEAHVAHFLKNIHFCSKTAPQRAAQIHPNDHFRLARAIEILTLTKKPVSQLFSGFLFFRTCVVLF